MLFDGATAQEDEYAAGTVLGGRFRTVGLVGRGGMGEVYRARVVFGMERLAAPIVKRGGADTRGAARVSIALGIVSTLAVLLDPSLIGGAHVVLTGVR